MANTVIQLKYSNITNKPPLLNVAEPAYSSVSQTLWIDDGTAVVAIGGKAYTDKIDAAASAATANVLVKRDTTGNASFNYVLADVVGSLYGNAQTATKLQTTRYFNLSGDIDSVSYDFNGTANVDATLELTNTGVSAGSYGGTTNIPVFTVDVDGRVTHAANVSVGTALEVATDNGSNTINLLTDTFTITGGQGITTSISANDTVSIDVDNTVVRSNTAILNQTIDGSITITGNLIVTGNTTTVDVTTLSVEDSLIALARNNTTDAVDIGFYGHYNDGVDRHAGIYRHAGDKQFYVFDNYNQEPTANTVNPAHASFRLATLHTNLTANTANADTLYVANRIYGDTTNNTLFLIPSTSYGGANHQYIVVDPTAPNHIHLRAGGTIDNSTAELFLGGENTGVQVSDNSKETYISANSHTWTFANDASLRLPGDIYLGPQGNNVIKSFGSDYLYIGAANTGHSDGALALSSGNSTSNARINVVGFNRSVRAHQDRFDFTKFDDWASYAVRVDTVNTSATSTTTGAIRVDGGAGITGNVHIGGQLVLSNALTVPQGGTGATSFTVGSILIGDGTSSLKELANTGTAGTYGSASYIPIITTDTYGRVSGVSNTAVNIDTSAIVSGTLGIGRGGTGASSFAVKGVIISDSASTTGAMSSLTSPTEGHVLQINSSGAPTFAHLNGGTF
jgi:hypothetical protein